MYRVATRLLRPARHLVLRAALLHQEAPDYYAILGVTKHSSLAEVKLAYYNMAKKFHPDTNKTLDARQMFSLIAEAYDVLSDKERRARYDETGLGEERSGGRAAGPGRQQGDTTYTSEEMYQRIFGDRGKEAAREEEEHVHTDYAESNDGSESTREYIAQISFDEAFLGVQLVVQFHYVGVCDKCRGDRSELGYTGNVCPYCEGTGEETIRTGHITARRTCTYCEGSRIFIKYKCHECEGLGRRQFSKGLKLNVPPGTAHGEVFRLEVDPAQLGRDVNSAPPVLWVTVSVTDSPHYRLAGRDLEAEVVVSPSQAWLGGVAHLPTPARSVPLTLPPLSSSGSVLVVAGEGLRTSTAPPGDLLVRTAIRVPDRLTWRQHRLAQAIARLEPADPARAVTGVDSPTRHKLEVNVVEASRTDNQVVVADKANLMQKTITEMLREKLGLRPPPFKPAYSHGYHRIFSI